MTSRRKVIDRLTQDILKLYEVNPFLIETAEGIARRIGRNAEEICPILSELVANSRVQKREENNSVIYVNIDSQSKPLSTNQIPSVETALTAREDEVLSLLLDGHTYASIAKELSISIHTVKNHVNSVYRKMNVCTRAELFARINELITT